MEDVLNPFWIENVSDLLDVVHSYTMLTAWTAILAANIIAEINPVLPQREFDMWKTIPNLVLVEPVATAYSMMHDTIRKHMP